MPSIEESVAEIRAHRIEVTKPLPVYHLTGPATELLPPGSGVFLVASEDSELFDDLEDALAHRDKGKIDALTQRNKQQVAALKAVSTEQAVNVLRSAPAFADLYYGVKPLAINVFPVAGTGFTRVFFSYVGGDFDASLFRLSEHLTSRANNPIQALIAVHEPTLSVRERAMLRRLPAESKGMLFGPGSTVMATPAALFATVTAGLIVAAAGTALGSCKPHFDTMDRVVLPATLEQTPALAIGQLLRARRQTLTQPSN